MTPGLLVLHGNRLEALAEVVFEWLARHPLAPLEEEVVLVPSNGMAEWFKMTLATSQGVCAATRVELPARFLWRVYRALLGRAAVPAVLPLDKQPLVWRLMARLPGWLHEHAADPAWSSLVAAMKGGPHDADDGAGGAAQRQLALCQRLADLFDQYQIYRPDWLADWADGHDQLRAAPPGLSGGSARRDPLPAEHAWQPELWRLVLHSLSPHERSLQRPVLHQRCLDWLQAAGSAPGSTRTNQGSGLPRRVVLFGSTQLPSSTLELLAALSSQVQVILAVPNPCRYFWADLIDGREALNIHRRRHELRGGIDLARLPLQAVQAHGHPLLAAWGRQARDFVRQLDAFDDVQRSRECFEIPRVDLFDDGPGETLLQQIQARIRDGVPLGERTEQRPQASDESVVFHVAHSAQREVEVLHDQLLHRFTHPPGGWPLHPRDVVVMVPSMDTFAPAIRAVFGQFPRGHARHIPWGIADVHERGDSPLLQSLEWLLRIRQHRLTAAEWRDVLEQPSIATRFGLREDEVSLALDWLAGVGVRWGLHAEQRAALGLAAAGETNTWRFGLRRMLLGYAAGPLDDGFDGTEPYDEVAGLSAGLAGQLSLMSRALEDWWHDAQHMRTPLAWAERLRSLLQTFFEAQEDADRAALAALDDAMSSWLQACEAAGFDEPLPLATAREAWLGALREPGQTQRFKAGGVTFCTLLPLRAIPFEVVCLLGMNEGDYPRAAVRADGDLMALPGLGRPGDRSRRDDDRQLMLDALLSARRVLHISWVGRSQRDNSEQPPSVLVAQLRDTIDAAWGEGVCAQRTVEHPLQPFSRRYFEVSEQPTPRLFTYATEWRQAHVAATLPAASRVPDAKQAGSGDLPAEWVVDLTQLASFLRNPVRFYFRHRLKVTFQDSGLTDLAEDESFGAAGLPWREWVADTLARSIAADAMPGAVDAALRRLEREGRLPLGGPGDQVRDELRATVLPMLAEWTRVVRAWPLRAPAVDIRLEAVGLATVRLQDTLSEVRSDDDDEARAILDLIPGPLTDGGSKPKVQLDKLVAAWLKNLACAAAGRPAQGVVIGTDVVVSLAPLPQAQAYDILQGLLGAVDTSLGDGRPLATAIKTGLAWLQECDRPDSDAAKARRAAGRVFSGDDAGRVSWAEGQEACLQRVFPTVEDLVADPGFETDTARLYGPLRETLSVQMQVDLLSGAVASGETSDD